MLISVSAWRINNIELKWDSQISPENNIFLSSLLSLAPDNNNKHFCFLLHSVGKCFLHIFVLRSLPIPVICEHDSEILTWISVPNVWCNGVTNKISVSYEDGRGRTITTIMTSCEVSFINRQNVEEFWAKSMTSKNKLSREMSERAKEHCKVTGFCW